MPFSCGFRRRFLRDVGPLRERANIERENAMVNTVKIVEIARANTGRKACDVNSAGVVGYYSSCQDGDPQNWCADFAKWV
jgi:hypothetical protein